MHKVIGTYLFFLFALSVQAQTGYSIDELLTLYIRTGNDIKNNYAQYQIDSLMQVNSRNKYKIQSDFAFSLPYAKSIEAIMQPDGSNKLTETNYISPVARLSLRKKTAFSGGEFAFFSSLNGYTDFINGNRQYGANWFNIQYAQNIFDFNEYKYELRKIKLQQGINRQALLSFNSEDVTSFVELIFQYYIHQQLLEENNKNREQNQELLKKKRSLLKYGKALPSDTLNIFLLLSKLQLKNEELNAKKLFAENRIKYKTSLFRDFELNINNTPLMLNLDKHILSERYLKYTLQKNAELELFELESEITRSRKNTGITTTISLGAGFNSKAEDCISNLTEKRLTDKENASLTFTVPISGWNTQKNRKRIASLRKEIYLREQENDKQEADFWAQDMVAKYKQALSAIELADKSLEAARELERILLKNIESGKNDYIALYQLYTDNQTVLLGKNNALRDIYVLKYDLTQKTFFDFENNTPLENYIK